jgi:polygalacturonase
VRSIHLKNSADKHLAFAGCNNLTIDWVTITAPGNSPNTDGIIMQGCQQVQITGCIIGTGTLSVILPCIFYFQKDNVSVLDEM